MVTFKSFSNIVLDILDYLRLSQPSLDTKPNSVARDLFVDSQALQISNIYDAIREAQNLQSIANLTGQDLSNYASNFGLTRTSGTKAIGTAVFTFRSMDVDVSIPLGSIVRTRNGVPFLTIATTVARASQANALRANATRLRQQLDTASITDQFAIEVSVQAQSTGTSGNVSSYSLVTHNVPGVNGVTNVSPFSGGKDIESDTSFRSRVLSTFIGANVGTAIGYRSTVLALPDAVDALVIEPGDPLMTRDGTVVSTNSDGTLVVTEPGTGGRVDIYVMGESIQTGTDSFVYNDHSGKTDPTDSSNDFILGQTTTTASTSLTLNSRRLATYTEGASVPNQPVIRITSVSGSSSGPNFIEQYSDSAGNLYGNYKLVKDTGVAAGSPFGLDKFVWTDNKISLSSESKTKGQLNTLDSFAFIDVSEVTGINQDIQVINENSTVQSTRSYIVTNHTPIKTVSRVFNLTTGERYTIVNQNPDNTSTLNTTGRVQISGRTLPTVSDVLQVDYTWAYDYDKYIDFDNLNPKDSANESQDSIDWGFSNYIRDELVTAVVDSYGNLTLTTEYPISRVLSINTYRSETSIITQSLTRKVVQVSTPVLNVKEIKDVTISGNPEIYNTHSSDGLFSNFVITLPSDTIAEVGDYATITYNLNNLLDTATALILNKTITLVPSSTISAGTVVKVNYVANFYNLIPTVALSTLPVSGDGFNSFVNIDGYQPVQNLYSGTVIVSNQRRSPTVLSVSTNNIPTQGTLRILGTTINKFTGIYTATSAGILDLSNLIRQSEELSYSQSIPTTISIARVVSVEAVTLNLSGEVTNVDHIYDLINYSIKNTNWDKANAVELTTLSQTQVKLSETSDNIANAITTGTNLRVTFYYSKTSDYEDLFFSRSGIAITQKVFGYIGSVSRISGFKDSGGTVIGSVIINSFNQPSAGDIYYANYNYTSPKENERITINYEYNQLLIDASNEIENNRPITADVLVKAATKIELDVECYIIVSTTYINQQETVRQNAIDNITATLNATSLGTTLDQSDIINNLYNVTGVDRVRITRFNITDVIGTKLSISAQKSEYLAAGNVTVTIEAR